jgi:phage tail-like protein
MAVPVTRKNLIDKLPYSFQKEDVTGDYAAWMEILQASIDNAYAILDRFKEFYNVDLTDLEAVVHAMLDNLGNPFDVSGLTLSQKRLLVQGLLELYRKFGTDDAVRDVVQIFTDLVVTDIIPGVFDGWELGVDVLGDGIHPIDFDTPTDFIVLWPSRLFQIYSFMIETDAAPTTAEEETIEKLMKIVKPVYMHYIGVHGWTPTPVFLHWEIGESELDTNTDVH